MKEILPGTGIILAGGAGKRMGFNKPMLPWRDGTLLEHVVGIVSAIMAETLIVGFRGHLSDRSVFKAKFIDEGERIGPLGGFLVGLEKMSFPKSLLVACDMPFISTRAVRLLWRESVGYDAAIPRSFDGCHPLFGVYDKTCLPHAKRAIEKKERKFVNILDYFKVNYLDVTGKSRIWNQVLLNINSRSEYQDAREMDGQTRIII